jgi:5-methylcytosine-specific restriction endonuclease McrA
VTLSSREVYILSALRRIWRWEPARKKCLQAENCALCKQPFPFTVVISARSKRKKMESYADHIEPACPIEGYRVVNGHPDMNQVYERMFVDENGLQALCDKCHSAKTKAENAEMRKFSGRK